MAEISNRRSFLCGLAVAPLSVFAGASAALASPVKPNDTTISTLKINLEIDEEAFKRNLMRLQRDAIEDGHMDGWRQCRPADYIDLRIAKGEKVDIWRPEGVIFGG